MKRLILAATLIALAGCAPHVTAKAAKPQDVDVMWWCGTGEGMQPCHSLTISAEGKIVGLAGDRAVCARLRSMAAREESNLPRDPAPEVARQVRCARAAVEAYCTGVDAKGCK